MKRILPISIFACVAHFLLSLYLSVTLERSFSELLASNAHFLMGMGLLLLLLKTHIKYRIPLFLSVPSIFFLIHCNYFILSSLKYFTVPSYPTFAKDVATRFGGSVAIAVSMYLTYLLMARWMAKQQWKTEDLVETLFNRKELLLLIPALVLAMPYFWEIFQSISRGYILENHQVSYFSLIIKKLGRGSFVCLILSIAIITFKKSQRKTWNTLGIILLTAFFILSLVLALRVGARHMVYFAIIAGLIGYSARNSFRAFNLMIILFISIEVASIVALGAITSTFNRVGSGQREGSNWGMEQNIQGLTYRSDLSDFAISLAKTDGRFMGGGTGMLADSFFNATPRVINPFKFGLIKHHWPKYLVSLGWAPPEVVDYPDTLFSIGYSSLGWPGLFLFMPAFMIVIMCIQSAIVNLRNIDPLIIITLLPFAGIMFFIEFDVRDVFSDIRNIILLVGVYYIMIRGIGIFTNR